jgi:protein STE50
LLLSYSAWNPDWHVSTDNKINGGVLVHLEHDALRDIGIKSVGHRLTILKNVYNVKIAHGVPFEPEHYVPVCAWLFPPSLPCRGFFMSCLLRVSWLVNHFCCVLRCPAADVEDNEKAATQQDIQMLIGIIRKRDEKIMQVEEEFRKLQDGMAKLREELLPVWRLLKDKNKALPTPQGLKTPVGEPDRQTGPKRGRGGDIDDRDQVQDPSFASNSSANLQPAPPGRGLSRKFSMKKLILGTPKNASPTHPTHPDNVRGEYEPPPQTATNGNATIANLQTSSPGNMPSPTSPSTIYYPSGQSMNNPTSHSSGPMNHGPSAGPPPRTRPPRSDYDDPHPIPSSGNSQSSVEIFKSFRVSMEDPCYKVLPAALKRYNIQADWRQYALYIVHGDQERCLGLDEKPLILFKQLDREGRKPMFMLRRNGNFDSGGGAGGGGPGIGSSGASVYGGRDGGITLPGGVL